VHVAVARIGGSLELGRLRAGRVRYLLGLAAAQTVQAFELRDALLAVGDCGKHARSAVGVSSLIFDIAVEIEMIVELR
jgi:hypothetical protein